MRAVLPCLLPLVACQSLTDPCYETFDATPDRCAGEVTVDATLDPPAFDVVNLAAADPTFVSVVHANPDDPCGGGVSLWNLRRFSAEDLPIVYGESVRGTHTWVNPTLSPEGEIIPLEDGETYVVSFTAQNRLPGNQSGSAPVAWSAMFVAGDPDSVVRMDEACW
jgi:hypothetical protein